HTRSDRDWSSDVCSSDLDHDGGKFAPIEAATVATWKARALLENLAIDAKGAIFVSVYSQNRVDRYDPATGATATSWRSIWTNLAAGTSGFRGIGSGRLCPNIRGRMGSRSARAGHGSLCQDAG